MKKALSSSIRARLLNLAKAEKSDFNSMLVRYGLERLLYRISISKYANFFMLKGALLFTLWYDMPHRPTRDADFLGYGNSDLATIEQIFREILSIPVEDGIVFLQDSISIETIKKDSDYSGARVEVQADLAKARMRIQVDIGFGDAVTPEPLLSVYPVLLEDFPAPTIKTYPVYTVISEKLHAITLLGMTNSRLKDYLDLFVILEKEKLNQDILAQAISATFVRRNTTVPKELPIGLTDEFANDASRQAIWLAFLKKNELEIKPLIEIVGKLGHHLRQPLIAAAELSLARNKVLGNN
jgi:hypothetical protein